MARDEAIQTIENLYPLDATGKTAQYIVLISKRPDK